MFPRRYGSINAFLQHTDKHDEPSQGVWASSVINFRCTCDFIPSAVNVTTGLIVSLWV